jgi:transcription antitermination factor NusG
MMVSGFPPVSSLAPIPGRAWYALRMDTRGMMPQTVSRTPAGAPTAERVLYPAQAALERHGYPTFVPTERWSRRRNRFTRERVYTTRALVPGLLFAAVPVGPEANWWQVMSLPFVRGVYGRLKPVGDADLVGVVRMVDMATEKIADPFSLKVGDVIEGPKGTALAGFPVELTELLLDIPEPVARGIVEIFGRSTPVAIPFEQLHGVRKDA